MYARIILVHLLMRKIAPEQQRCQVITFSKSRSVLVICF